MALPVDLVFLQAPLTSSPVNLVFGDTAGLPADVSVIVAGTLPGLTGALSMGTPVDLAIAGTLPGLTGVISALYISGASRPTVGSTSSAWQAGAPREAGIEHKDQDTLATPAGVDTPWQSGARRRSSAVLEHGNADHTVGKALSGRFQEAQRLQTGMMAQLHQEAVRTARLTRVSPFQNASRLQTGLTVVPHQDALRNRRNWAAARWQEAVAQYLRYVGSSGTGVQVQTGWETDFQKAMRPPPGTSSWPTNPPAGSPCYTPPLGNAVHLLFRDPWTADTNLVFVCENHGPGASVVVPIKRVYVVLNESTLHRVDGHILLPTFGMSLSLDVDSWTWTFSASLPEQALNDLMPNAPGEPVLVEAMINGVAYGIQIDKRGRDRTFTNRGIKISGRGLATVLDSPYAPVMNHSNDEERTAQQLMNDVLTDNGVSLGWEIDYQAVDWTVPAGLFAHQGSYIEALNAIAQAAGSYIQPHPTDQVLHVLPRYPALPWDWAGVTPDFEIPSAVATVENIEWMEKARYNRVYVSGTRDGINGQVTRAGTDGSLVAPMITDSLITTAAAARQRGTPVLADTGSQARISLRMPVLEETGIIVPGKFVRYTDGDTVYRGLARGVSVDVRMPEIWQTIVLETHVL